MELNTDIPSTGVSKTKIMLQPSTIRQKTEQLFSGYSSNAFDPDESEWDEPSSNRMVCGISPSLNYSSLSMHTSATVSLSLVSAEADKEGYVVEQSTAVDLPSKQYLGVSSNTQTASPDLSTLKHKSMNVFGRQAQISSDFWTGDDNESVERIESICLRPTIRGNLLKSKGNSPSLSKEFPSTQPRTKDKENVIEGFGSRVLPSPPQVCGTSQAVLKSLNLVDNAATTSDTGGKASAAVRSIWDVEDNEFDRWPSQEELDDVVKSFTLKRGTFKGITRAEYSTKSCKPQSNPESILNADDEDPKAKQPNRSTNLTEQEHADFIDEFADKNCGNPNGVDAHDEVMQQFYRRDVNFLPASHPARHMHLIAHTAYLSDKDTIVKQARPRLADAVATVLYNTSPKCLAEFLDSDVKTFEWRRDGNCLMIHREGNQVIAGTFHNYGTYYLWTYFVRSEISDTDAWKEVYAGASQVVTPVSTNGVEFEKFVEDSNTDGVEPTDEKFALHIGRSLGLFLLKWSIWDFRAWRRWNVEWEANGIVSNARDHSGERICLALEEKK
jgi:hypothetical protein